MDRTTTTRATYLIMTMFFLQPLVIGGWLALIPLIKENLGLSKGQLSIALLGAPLALLPSLQVAGRLLPRYGPRRFCMVFFPVQSVTVLLVLVAWSGPSLFAALFCLGAGIAFLEVAINVYAGRLEKRERLTIMNRCHGFWALGLATGSAFLTLMIGTPWIGLLTLVIVSIVVGVFGARLMPQLGDDETTEAPPKRKINDLPRALFFIATFMFLVTLAEGAMADWAAVYLAERLGDANARAGVAVTIFSAFLAGGRFVGDILKVRLGPVLQAKVTTICAVIGLLLLVVPLPLWCAYLGFAMVGFGVSSAYPLGVSAIAALDDRYEASNIAIMATVAMGAFLVGPPLIGLVSEAYSLSIAFATLVPGLLIAVALTRWLRVESPK
ncbi:MFS transporter [Rhodobacteraceae bacterium]|nr:MFS transporter [Paracoccaceae bacterium]